MTSDFWDGAAYALRVVVFLVATMLLAVACGIYLARGDGAGAALSLGAFFILYGARPPRPPP